MPKSKTQRITAGTLRKDRHIAAAVLLLKDYSPANADFSADRLRQALHDVEAATTAEKDAQNALVKARMRSLELECTFHELTLGAKRQVIAQYGDDSPEIAALGLKRRSERRYGRPRKNPTQGANEKLM